MQKGSNTDNWAKKKGLYAMGWYKFGCICCGPKNGEDRQIEHQAVRAMLKREDFFDGEEDDLPQNL